MSSEKANTIEKSIEVDVPISTAYNQWTQFESFPRFMGGVEEVTQIDDTHTHWKAKVGGVKREFDAVITEQRPDERIAWTSTDGKNHSGVAIFEAIDFDTTRVTVQMGWEPEGLIEKAGAALGLDEAQVKNDLEKFKELIESNGFEDGAWRGEVSHGIVETEDKTPSTDDLPNGTVIGTFEPTDEIRGTTTGVTTGPITDPVTGSTTSSTSTTGLNTSSATIASSETDDMFERVDVITEDDADAAADNRSNEAFTSEYQHTPTDDAFDDFDTAKPDDGYTTVASSNEDSAEPDLDELNEDRINPSDPLVANARSEPQTKTYVNQL